MVLYLWYVIGRSPAAHGQLLAADDTCVHFPITISGIGLGQTGMVQPVETLFNTTVKIGFVIT